MAEPRQPWSLQMIFEPIINRPVLLLQMAAMMLIGVGISFAMVDAKWGLLVRFGVGLVLGLTANLSFFLNRMIANDFD